MLDTKAIRERVLKAYAENRFSSIAEWAVDYAASDIPALCDEVERLRKALSEIESGAPINEPERSESSNYGDVEENAMAREHYRLAQIARNETPQHNRP